MNALPASRSGPLLALLSALLFGVTTPLSKLLLGGLSPPLLAALLYLGSGLGLLACVLVQRLAGRKSREAPLRLADLPWLGGLTLSGGVIAPLLLFVALEHVPASAASLLLNLEGVFTIAIAWAVFRENVDRRIAIGAGAILLGALLLSWPAEGVAAAEVGGLGWGALGVAGACFFWAIDSNLTRKVSAADPAQIAMIKGLAAGSVNLAIALASGAAWPAPPHIAAAALLGFLGYGISLTFYVAALRALGTARTAAYYAFSPFIGAVVAILIFGEPVTMPLVAAGALMALGLYLHLAERHEHDHVHEGLDHEHSHIHDAHHHHRHDADDPLGEPHTHRHRHAPLTHSHAHYPDLHHRHSH